MKTPPALHTLPKPHEPTLKPKLCQRVQSCPRTWCKNEDLIVFLKRMKYRLKNIKNWKLAILFSAILSLFGVISNTTPQSDFDIYLILPTWFSPVSFLLVAWYLNSIITNQLFFNDKKWNLTSKIKYI